MREIVISGMQGVNLEALDDRLRALPGAAARGISLRRGSVIVHLDAEAAEEEIAAIRSLVRGHDPRQLSAAQQVQKQRADQIKTAHADARTARQAAAGASDVKQQVALLARRIDWLEKLLEALVAGDKPFD